MNLSPHAGICIGLNGVPLRLHNRQAILDMAHAVSLRREHSIRRRVMLIKVCTRIDFWQEDTRTCNFRD